MAFLPLVIFIFGILFYIEYLKLNRIELYLRNIEFIYTTVVVGILMFITLGFLDLWLRR